MYSTFHRTWWKPNLSWPDGREPQIGRKTWLEEYDTEEEAREACQEWNAIHPPGPMSRKAEYQKD